MFQKILAVGMIGCLVLEGVKLIRVGTNGIKNKKVYKNGIRLAENGENTVLEINKAELENAIHNGFDNITLSEELTMQHVLRITMGICSIGTALMMLNLLVKGV